MDKLSQRISKLVNKSLIELFRTTLNKGEGDLFATKSYPEEKLIQEIAYLMREYSNNVDMYKAQVIAEREKNTKRRNGIEIRTEEIISQVVCKGSQKIK